MRGSRRFRTKAPVKASTFFVAVLLLHPCAAGAERQSAYAETEFGAEPVEQHSTRVDVLYLTNRRRRDQAPVDEIYGGDRGEPHFGRCRVQFTPIPVMDKVAEKMSFYVASETNVVRLAERIEAGEFWQALGDALRQTTSGSLVVFVHGYNYGFERTCRMTAEIQRNLGGKAGVLMFGWPSNGLPTDYVRDQADLEWSVPVLASLLGDLGERIGRENLQVLAHSLGSRGVVFALQRLAADQGARPLIHRLVLLAPDFDSQTFVELLPRLAPLTGGITLYASDQDTPLKVSRQLSGHPRLGEAGDFLTLAQGMETVDVSPAGRYQIWGHEYFHFNPRVAKDLAVLLGTGASAAERSGLRPNRRDGYVYWEIR